MKVKELIKKLQEADPTGELQVDGAFYGVDRMAGYYDCPCSWLEFDEDGRKKSYNIDYKHDKVRIYGYEDYEDLLAENPDFPVNVIDDNSNPLLLSSIARLSDESYMLTKQENFHQDFLFSDILFLLEMETFALMFRLLLLNHNRCNMKLSFFFLFNYY